MKISVAIIAGGKSKRFGASKAVAKLGGHQLIDYAIDTAVKISSDVMIVYGDKNWIIPKDIQIYQDKYSDSGPLGGIYTALFHAKQSWIAILPCDMPFLSPNIYQFLFQNRDKFKPVVAASSHGLEPMVAIWPKSMCGAIEELILLKEKSVRRALIELNAKVLPVRNELSLINQETFLNINFKEDLENIKTELS
ncbi:molybdenum cofactor guanylyltransferase [candidate division KSB1 bacterium]|nr:molybdenum cofactor guanylyltransferase [candidate division KSB1 bacterium]